MILKFPVKQSHQQRATHALANCVALAILPAADIFSFANPFVGVVIFATWIIQKCNKTRSEATRQVLN